MKNYLLLLSATILLLSFSSCSNSDPIEENVRKEVKVRASFKNLSGDGKVTTRAVDNVWESGDAIGIFMKKGGTTLVQPALSENVKYTTTDLSSFSPATEADKLYYPFDKSEVDFISYYPYKASLDGLNYEVDVSTQSNLSAIDLLYSNNVKEINSSSESVNLSFEHQLTKVVLKIGTNYTEKELSTLSAKITNLNTKALFSLVDGTITAAIDPADVTFNLNTEKTIAQAIVLPESDLTNKKLIISLDGTTYSYLLSSSAIISSFEKSKQYEYTITIEPTHGPNLNGVTAHITNWTTVSDDITVTEDPSETSPEEGVDDPEGENTPTDPGEGDDIVVGDGTKDNPYTIAQAKNISVGQIVWVKGYIVGDYTAGHLEGFTSEHNATTGSYLALADKSDESDYQLTFPVKITGMPGYEDVNLKSNYENLGKVIALEGSISSHVSFELFFKDVKKAFLEGVEIK